MSTTPIPATRTAEEIERGALAVYVATIQVTPAESTQESGGRCRNEFENAPIPNQRCCNLLHLKVSTSVPSGTSEKRLEEHRDRAQEEAKTNAHLTRARDFDKASRKFMRAMNIDTNIPRPGREEEKAEDGLSIAMPTVPDDAEKENAPLYTLLAAFREAVVAQKQELDRSGNAEDWLRWINPKLITALEEAKVSRRAHR